MALNTNALTTVAVAKEHLEIPVAVVDQDSLVERLINSASDFFENETNRKLVTATHTDYQDGRSSNRIMLAQYPITGGPAAGGKPELFIDNSSVFGSGSARDVATYFVDGDSEIILIGGDTEGAKFPKGVRNIKIVYDAGIGTIAGDNIPAHIVDACLDYVLWKYERQNDRRIGKTNKSKGDENVSYESDLPASIRSVLDKITKIDFAPPVGVLNS
jgi:hypothetical protein